MAGNAVLIEIEKIRRDGGTQSRVQLDESTVAEYAAAMESGAKFPPVVVYYDGTTYWLADGFHRIAAWLGREVDAVEADVLQGTQRDAILHSVGVNASHGLRRSNDDKRRAVEVMLRDEEWREWSDREIARRAGVDHKTVGKWRGELFARGEIPQASGRLVQQGGDARLMTDPSYPVEPSDSADVEAARQFAVDYLAKYATADELKAAMKDRTGGVTPDGIHWQLGVGYLSDGPDSSQSVTAKQIGVAMTTVNGNGVFRFDAFNLWKWTQERELVLKDPKTFTMLLTIAERSGNVYIDSKVAKDLARYGLAASDGRGGNYVTAPATTRRIVEAGLKDYPLLDALMTAKREAELGSSIDSGVETLKELYEKQAHGKQWVPGKDLWRWDAAGWLPAAADQGLIRVEGRPAADNKEVTFYAFYAVTGHLCEMLGKKVLPEPEPLPELPYNHSAKVFVPADAAFIFAVGDLVTARDRNGVFKVVALGDWPVVQISHTTMQWTPYFSQFELSLFAGGAEAVEKLVEKSEHDKIDEATGDIWDALFELGIDLNHYPDKELAEQLRISLNTMIAQLVSSESGQRLGLDNDRDDDEEDES